MTSDLIKQYLDTKRRIADLEFYKIETAFLLRLLDDYFIRLSAPLYLAKLKRAGKQFYQLETDLQQTGRHLNQQLKQLEMIFKGASPKARVPFATTAQFEERSGRLTKDYGAAKTNLFLMIAKIKHTIIHIPVNGAVENNIPSNEVIAPINLKVTASDNSCPPFNRNL
ncbi:hypothetical protein G7092_06195 [Mucilaginibacter sp. HC2]|uniref:hypothetical protein n=1 Tax=Mucilaginibacter inviolabilis TaxID=2714892 RepID=UPI001407F214|nr:hypothetical protein [Mucilaginibacter inviolabilis]NHA03374.1 hypothetical protein [Mucilaginibacter inviolabilis]